MTASPALRHRADIQGLRALAVGTVVAYHAGTPYLDGGFVGVDLFFVISGFLITSLLVAEVGRSASISLADFWARRARRILPASTIVLIATAIGVALFTPALERPAVTTDLTWATLFSANWRFAEQGTDYLAADRATSPVLHYWSLGVEEQFYVFWPLIAFVVLVLICRGRRQLGAAMLSVVTVAIVAISLWWCIVETEANQPYAYFGTFSRAWQLGLGCLLALTAHWLVKMGRTLANVLALAGMTGLVVSVLTLQEAGGTTPYPGVAALLPTLSAVFLLAAGIPHVTTWVGRVLSIRPLQHLGDISYSWYLWHFPVLILGAEALGTTWQDTVSLVSISYFAAVFSYKFIETPLRKAPELARKQWRSLFAGAVMVAMAAVAVTQIPLLGKEPARTVTTTSGADVVLRPSPADAPFDSLSMRDVGCDLDIEQTDVPDCSFADVGSDRQVVLLGDSHAVVMHPPLAKAAAEEGWQLNNWTKSACPVADITVWAKQRDREFTECDEFREEILDRTISQRPDAVVISFFTSGSRIVLDRETGEPLDEEQGAKELVKGLRRVLQRFSAESIPVILVVDAPSAPFDVPTCLADEAATDPCTFEPRPTPTPEVEAARRIDGVSLLSFSDEFCTAELCSPILDDVLLYRDSNHLTKTYALTLTDRFAALLAEIDKRPNATASGLSAVKR